jgi:hypothetical protein
MELNSVDGVEDEWDKRWSDFEKKIECLIARRQM